MLSLFSSNISLETNFFFPDDKTEVRTTLVSTGTKSSKSGRNRIIAKILNHKYVFSGKNSIKLKTLFFWFLKLTPDD